MKKLLLTTLVALTASVATFAQSNFIFFTENGEQFYLILNGIRQNGKPETNVKVNGLNSSMIKARIIFADTTLGFVDKNLFLPAEPAEQTYVVKRDKSNKFVVRFMGEVPVASAPAPPPTQAVVVYTTTPAPLETAVVTQSTTTTTTNANPTGVNVNLNVPGVNINVNANDAFQQTANTTTVTTTTTTSSTNTYNNTPTPTQAPPKPAYVLQGYNGRVGCPYPMTDGDFQSAKASIASKSFEDSKLTVAKQIFDSNCLLSSQVKQIMQVFSFEASKLDFAKYANGRTYDISNYYKVNDAFEFSSSIDELNAYIQNHK